MADHVFRERADGGLDFIGNFEGLYREQLDPWGQSATSGPMADYYAAARERLVWMILAQNAMGRGLEIGSGHGHVTALLAGKTNMEWEGMDISASAVARARELFPDLTFRVGDIRKGRVGGVYDVVLLNQLLWYVLDRFDDVVANCHRLLVPGGLLIVAQAFLKEPQRYAAEIASGFHGLIDLFDIRYRAKFRLISAQYDASGELVHNDGVLIFQC